MSFVPTKPQTLLKSSTSPVKDLSLWFESLANQEKCRITRITSTDLIALISKTIADLDLLEDIPNKPVNSKKVKQKGQISKISDEALYETLFDSLLVFSEVDYLDSIGLDFNLVKDSAKMIEILSTLALKNSNHLSLTALGFQQINSKQDISILVSVKILEQLKEARELKRLPSEQPSKRRDIGNCWLHLEPLQKSTVLNLECSSTAECTTNLCKKGVIISSEILEKQIRQLTKLQKNQFCNRLLKCRLKKMNSDPIKGYHRQVYKTIVNLIKFQKKKKAFKKQIAEHFPIIHKQKEEQKKQEQVESKYDKNLKLKRIELSPDSSIKEESKSQEIEARVKSYSVSSNQTNNTQSKLDLKYFGEDTFQKKIQALYKYKVANDLIDLGDMIGEKANSYQKYRFVAFNRVQCVIGYEIPLLLFGSCANGLMIEKSDVDVAISHNILNYFPYGSIKERVVYALSHVHQLLSQQPWVSHCQLITTASIPVLKLQIDTSVKIQCPAGISDDEDTFKGYPKDNIKIQMDVTIDTSLLQGESNHLGLQATQMMKNWMAEIPNLYSISILLKYLFQKKQFNSTYKGGMGSYCTMVMILAYLKHFKKENEDLSSQVQGFIDFFCNDFDESTKGVDIAKDTHFYTKQVQDPKIQVKDPINGRVMTRNTYLYPKIKQQLMKLKKKCFQNIRDQVLSHIESIEEKEERQYILGIPHKEYFTTFQTRYSKNIFCEYDFN